MNTLTVDVSNYLEWLQVHNYAATTITSRRYYLAYFLAFAARRGLASSEAVQTGDLGDYQQELFAPPQGRRKPARRLHPDPAPHPGRPVLHLASPGRADRLGSGHWLGHAQGRALTA